jgi:hypothetical protein
LRDIPDLKALVRFGLHPLLERFVQFAQNGLGTFALRYVFRDDVDADDATIRVSQRVPVCYPDVIRIAPVGLLPTHLHAGDGFACALNGLNELFDLLRDGWHRLANRTADMIGYRNTTNFREALIDMHVPAIE